MATEPQLGEAATLAIKPVRANIFARSATAPHVNAEAPPSTGAFATDAARPVGAARGSHRTLPVRPAVVVAAVLAVVVVFVPRLVSGSQPSTRAIKSFRVVTATPSVRPPVRATRPPRPRRHQPARRRPERRHRMPRPSSPPRRAPAPAVPVPPVAAPRPALPTPVPATRPAPPASKPKRPVPASVPDGSPPEFL